jgi:hypothetical protein
MHIFRFELSSGAHIQAAAIDYSDDEVLGEVVSALHTSKRSDLVGCNLLVVRPPTAIQRAAEPLDEERAAFDELKRRFPGKSIAILCSSGYEHILGSDLISEDDGSGKRTVHNAIRLDSSETKLAIIASLRQQELQAFVVDSDAFMPRNANFRYRHPSGAYADTFLRVGNIQVSRHVLDTIFFWAIPYLREVEGIVVDTWSISSIVLNISRLVSRYDPSKGRFRIEMLGHYLDGRPGTRAELASICRKVSGNFTHKFLIVFSSSMTGRSLRRLRRALGYARCPNDMARFCVLYRLGKVPVEVDDCPIPELCDFSEHVHEDAADGPLLAHGRLPIAIHRTTYFPTIVREREQRIRKNVTAKNRGFYNRYRQSNAIRVHADAWLLDQRYRHHGILVDVSILLRQKVFESRLAKIIHGLTPVPDILISPPHDAGIALAETVRASIQERTGRSPGLCRSLDLSNPNEIALPVQTGDATQALDDLLKKATESDAIMIIDDVVTTGQRLLTFQRNLRSIYAGQIHYLVAVARMPSVQNWTDLCATLELNTLGRPHTVTAVEEVVLPDWDEATCPWCEERRILEDIGQANNDVVSEEVLERANLLRAEREFGLCDNVFFEGRDTPPMQLSPNSTFVENPVRPSVVVAAVASTLQEMRSAQDPKKLLMPNGFPLRSVLTIRDFDRYTDSILISAILRVASTSELGRTDEEQEVKRTAWARLRLQQDAPEARQMRRELLLAILAGKLPRECLDAETLEALRTEGYREFCRMVEHDTL